MGTESEALAPRPGCPASPNDYQCSICCDLLLDPVVGSCGHDFCKGCLESWHATRYQAGVAVHCPLCRAVLLPPSEPTGYGVCIRLRETLEMLFPEQIEARRKQSRLASTQGLPVSQDTSLGPTSAAATGPATHISSAATSALSQLGGGPAVPGSSSNTLHANAPPGSLGLQTLLNPQLFSNAADQYRELTHIVSALTAVPPPSAPEVSAFMLAVQREVQRSSNMLLNGQQASEVARNYLMTLNSGILSQAVLLQQQQQSAFGAHGSPAAGVSLHGPSPAQQAALALLTSAAATSTAADQLCTLLSTLQAENQPLPAASHPGLQATAISMQQLMAQTAALSNTLRSQYANHLQQQQQQYARALMQARLAQAQAYMRSAPAPVRGAAAAPAAAAPGCLASGPPAAAPHPPGAAAAPTPALVLQPVGAAAVHVVGLGLVPGLAHPGAAVPAPAVLPSAVLASNTAAAASSGAAVQLSDMAPYTLLLQALPVEATQTSLAHMASV